jgi:toxin ParE1/3/4
MSRFVITDPAERDLDEISDCIGGENPSAAIRLLRRLHEKFRLLATQPLMGERRPDLCESLRSFNAGSYVIFFQPIEDGVEIVRVLHGARNIRELFRNPER